MASDDSPRGSNLSLWLLGLLAVGGAALFGLPRASELAQHPPRQAEPASDDRQSTTPSAEPGAPGPLSVLREHFKVSAEAPSEAWTFKLQWSGENAGTSRSVAVDAKSAGISKSRELAYYLGLEPAKYEFLIATVPDPVDSKFAMEFDTVVDGIQRAFEARDFTLRSSWLPWPRHQNEKSKKERQADIVHREYPGTLLFRRISKSKNPTDGEFPTLALVCLVGETPTFGIHKPALTKALELRENLDAVIKESYEQRLGLCDRSPGWADFSEYGTHIEVPIVAPYFSGSQSSLLLTLKQRASPQMRFRVISGSATALRKSLFCKAGVELRTTVIPNELLTRAVLCYLAGNPSTYLEENNDRITKRVAILRESNTPFGAERADATKAEKESDVENYSPVPWPKEGVIDLPFPLSISRLNVDVAGPGARLPPTEFVEPRLQVRDLPQVGLPEPYDPASATTTAGESLRSILTTIARARVRYVGIVATDSRDVVYLNRLIRQQCPHVRVFTTEPSIALTHPDEAYHLRGMVVGSTYPLHPITQYWARLQGIPDRRMIIPFPNQGSEGYYNAVLAHFGECDKMLDYRPPGLANIPAKWCNRPPIWISIVGQGGRLTPVHCFTNYEMNEEDNPLLVPGKTPVGTRPSPFCEFFCHELPEKGARPWPVAWVSVGVMLASLAAIGALAIVILALTVPALWRKWAGGINHAAVEEFSGRSFPARPSMSQWDTPCIWAWRGVMLLGILLFAMPYTLLTREMWDTCCGAPSRWHWSILAAGITATSEVIVVTGLLVLRAGESLGLRLGALLPEFPRHRKDAWGYGLLAGVALLVAILAWTWWERYGNPDDRFFLYVRATDLSGGLSPLVPMGLLGGAAFVVGFFSLRQADQARQAWLNCPYPAAWDKIQRADERLRDELCTQHRFLNWDSIGVILLLGVPLLLCAAWNVVIIFLPSGEGQTWDWLMRIVLWLTVAAVVLTLARFLALWSRLSDLLEEILRVPMVGAFERLPDEIGRLFGGYLYSQHPHHRHLAAAAWSLPYEEQDQLASKIKSKRPGLASVLSRPPQNKEAKGADWMWLIRRLERKARDFLFELPSQWRNRPVNEAFGVARPAEDVTEKTKKKPTGKQDRTTQMETYVASFVVLYLGQYFSQLRMLVYAFAIATPLLLFAAASYPFQPNQLGINALLGLLAAVVLGTLYVLYKINRDGLVSRVTRTTPHRFTPDRGFLSSVTVYILPLVVILLAHVFGLFRFILEPILGLFQ
jgi:hypothetical protein